MKQKYLVLFIIFALLLTACGNSTTPEPTPDVVAVRTSAASTVVSQFTLTAAAFTPTPSLPNNNANATEPALGITATETEQAATQATNAEGTPDALCDKFQWDDATVDVNYPDDTPVTPGQDFIKTWKVKNIGTCTWGAGYTTIYAGYTDKMSGKAVAFGEILPGQEVEISVQFKAPSEAGTYVSAWTLANAAGIPFFGDNVQGTYTDKPLIVKILVQ